MATYGINYYWNSCAKGIYVTDSTMYQYQNAWAIASTYPGQIHIGGAVKVPPTIKDPRTKLRDEIESWCGNVLEVA